MYYKEVVERLRVRSDGWLQRNLLCLPNTAGVRHIWTPRDYGSVHKTCRFKPDRSQHLRVKMDTGCYP